MLSGAPGDLRKIKVFSAQDFPNYLPKLNSLYDDLFSDGKGFRAFLIQRLSAPLGLSEAAVSLLSQTIEFIHNASLLHDDLVDRSPLRRGKPSAWLKYTPEYAVLAGDYLLARVMVNLSDFGKLQLIRYTAEVISDLLEGEWIQDSLVRDWNIGLEQLDRVHQLKTASLFKWCLRAPFLAGDNENPALHKLLQELGAILGLLFQRSDDLLDFNIRNYENKAVLGDLKSGYLNSFAAFLMVSLTPEQKRQFIGSQTMADVEAAVGADYFASRLEDFDQNNRQWIALYSHYCGELENLLPTEQKSLVNELRPLTQLLYWRKKA